MMNKQLAFVKSGLGLALCFLMVGAGVTPPIHASNANVSISQQAKKVTGTVTDAKGEPLLGVNVVVKGTTNGTITDLDGKYSLEVEPNSILVVSYIGYVSQQIPASGEVVNVTLKEDTQNLDEVVVVGYGTQQKKDITGAATEIHAHERTEDFTVLITECLGTWSQSGINYVRQKSIEFFHYTKYSTKRSDLFRFYLYFCHA